MLKITGYSDQISVAPGDTIRFMVSCDGIDSYEAAIVRIISGDTNPDGPGIKEEEIDTSVNGNYPGRKQVLHAGSYVVVPTCPAFEALTSFTVQAMIYPTRLEKGPQSLIAKWSNSEQSGFALMIDNQGSVALRLGDGRGQTDLISVGKPMLEKIWYFVAASYDAVTKEVCVYQEPLVSYPTIDDMGSTRRSTSLARVAENTAPLLMAGHFAGMDEGRIIVDESYNGKIDSPRIAKLALGRSEMESLKDRVLNPKLRDTVVAAWDFSLDIMSEKVRDISPNAMHGETVNMPARGVTGYNFTGEEICWRHKPEHYGAIKFHDDDIYDAGWKSDFELTISAEMKSGVYAARLRCGEDEEYIPFVVRPKPGHERKIAYLFPSATYMAYANEHFATNPWILELMTYRAIELSPHHEFLNEHREYGHSMYDSHSDGTGVYHSSRLRPMLNMRPKRQGVLGGAGSQLWKFNADTHIIDWLEASGYEYDVITDEDLHYRGMSALSPYSVLLTSTHPEYVSKQMYDAIYDYTQRGGRLMYLGANGFYWRIAYHQTKPGIIELRRAEGGGRAWIPPNGEYYHSFTGEYGGMWRRQGNVAPQVITGIGFTAQGFDICSYYRRKPDSFDSRAKFVFEGIGDEELIGNFGLIGGGAAGIELDRVDRNLGSPPHTLLLASSENHTDTYLLVVEDIMFNYPGTSGSENEWVRADMAFYETPNGGAVFSTGSISWAGSLSHNNYNNNVSRITGNVLTRFLDSTPFV